MYPVSSEQNYEDPSASHPMNKALRTRALFIAHGNALHNLPPFATTRQRATSPISRAALFYKRDLLLQMRPQLQARPPGTSATRSPRGLPPQARPGSLAAAMTASDSRWNRGAIIPSPLTFTGRRRGRSSYPAPSPAPPPPRRKAYAFAAFRIYSQIPFAYQILRQSLAESTFKSIRVTNRTQQKVLRSAPPPEPPR